MIKSLVELAPSQIESDSLLRQRSVQVTDFGAPLQLLIADLNDTLLAHEIAIGLAGPQIGVNERVAVINISEGKKSPTIVIVNPRDVRTSGKRDMKRESCMSLPHYAGSVERRSKIKFTCEDETGKTIEIAAEGFLARVYCHEIDHLDGLLYIDRMEPGVSLEEVDFFRKGKVDKASSSATSPRG